MTLWPVTRRQRLRHDVERNAEPRRERGAVAVVPVEELDHARRLAEPAHALREPVDVDRVDQPDAAVGLERVRRPPVALPEQPAEAERKLVDDPVVHGYGSSCRSNTAGGAKKYVGPISFMSMRTVLADSGQLTT